MDLRKCEARLRQAERAAKLGFWDYEVAQDHLSWSEAIKDQWGVTHSEGSKKDVYDRIHPDDAMILKNAFEQTLITGAGYHVELRVLKDDGEITWIESQCDCELDQGRVVRISGTSLDITTRKRSEAELWLAKVAAEEANAAKTQFLANMSHEIRTPLGAIVGFLGLLKNQNLSRSTFRNYVSVIERNSDQLLRLVNDILDLSKVEAGRMLVDKSEIKLPEFLSEVASLMSFKAKERGIQFELAPGSALPSVICADPMRIRQILGNVVGNAIKFTDQGEVRLGVSFESPMLSFHVKDTGPGMSEAQQERLFRPFSQADASIARKFGGTGLGLVLTKKLCELLGGDLKLVSSEPGVGSEFSASFEIEVPAQAEMLTPDAIPLELSEFQNQEKTELRLAGMKVLVVEDSPDNRELIEILLSQAGAQVDLACDGLDGVHKALKNTYHAVLMDIQMPELDGHQAAQRLRSEGYLPPLVALTAHAMKEEQERCLLSGFTHFLSKPIHYEMMLSTLEGFQNQPTELQQTEFALLAKASDLPNSSHIH